GKFHKVANIVGSCMKYHPHGDASIYSAIVVMANKELFIDKQGNFGNILTGDEASAARYIECRATSLAKDVFYNPKITEYEESYDGRNKEPVVFPAKIPVILVTGAEGIAVGMSTKILPHNPVEVLEAEIACLRGESFSLYPDFLSGGIVDVTEYQDGLGKVRVRATMDTSDPKRVVIRDLPYGVTTESLIASVEDAARAGRIKIASISDFTTDKVEIEVRLARGVYAQETIDALYAFTQCEQSISCNLLVIKSGQPTLITVTDVIRHHAKRLLAILKAELELEVRELLDEVHARTLERIFIEERIYKSIETKKTQPAIDTAVIDGLAPFASEIKREVTPEDVERLLRIPIRRISLYDIEKARNEMERLKTRLKEARHHLAHLTEYGIGFLEGLLKRLKADWKRKTRISSFDRVDAREVARRDIALRYDAQTGYLGTSVTSGETRFDVSPYDKVLVIRRSGMYSIVPVPEKLFVDKGLLYCGLADKEQLADTIFSVVYTEAGSSTPLIKRCQIEAWILAKDYELVPKGSTVRWFTATAKAAFVCTWAPKPRFKIDTERFRVESYPIKGIKARGVRLSARSLISAHAEGGEDLFEAASTPRVRTAKTPKKKAASVSTSTAKKKTPGKTAATKDIGTAKTGRVTGKSGKVTGSGGLLAKATSRKKK
ncbi:MAG: DNA topoisomerase IV subunit A, partial [Spirochaetales bacterium]|nr:DNA topoisomerase IV subunit A [Spirochaetales bacterium]